MPIIEPSIRPPAEADSFLLQITTGCSSNSCTFCGAYKEKLFRVKSDEEIFQDIAEGAKWAPDHPTSFFNGWGCFGDQITSD